MAKKKYNKKKKKPSPARTNTQKKEPVRKTVPAKKQKPGKEKLTAVQPPKEKASKAVPLRAEKPPKEKAVRPKKAKSACVSDAKKPGRLQKLRYAAIAVLALILACAIPLAVVSRHNEKLYERVEFTYAGLLQRDCLFDIEIDENEQAQRVEEMKRHGQKNAFGFFCNASATFDSPTSYGAVTFANVQSNNCILVFAILDENGEMLYRSGGIKPGKYVSQIPLARSVESGTHACKLYAIGYDRSTYACVGVQYTDIEIRIGAMENG